MPVARNPQEVMQLQQSMSTPLSRLVETLAQMVSPFSPLGMSVPTPPPPAGQSKSNLDTLTTILALAPIAAGGIGMVMKGKGESPETISNLRKALAEIPFPGRPRVKQPIPAQVQQIEELGTELSTTAKPQGLHTPRADVVSPHADLGGESPETIGEMRKALAEIMTKQAGPGGLRPDIQTIPEPFAQSVVREGQKLKTVYHGTGAGNFKEFEIGKENPNSLYGPGFYFTEDPAIASTPGYAKGEAATVRPVHLDIRRPFDINAPADPDIVRTIQELHFDYPLTKQGTPDLQTNHDVYHVLLGELGNKSEVNDWLDANGFDGITHIGGVHGGKKHRVWIAFYPSQIRPAFGRGK